MTQHEPMRIVGEPCDQCPFKGRFAGAPPGMIKQLVEECRRKDQVFNCHKTYLDNPNPSTTEIGATAAVCAGWLEVGEQPQALQVALRLGLTQEVEA